VVVWWICQLWKKMTLNVMHPYEGVFNFFDIKTTNANNLAKSEPNNFKIALIESSGF
jgi:hypothetical protein